MKEYNTQVISDADVVLIDDDKGAYIKYVRGNGGGGGGGLFYKFFKKDFLAQEIIDLNI